MTPLYTIADIRAIERAMFAATPSFDLMQQAGDAVAQAAEALLADKTAAVLAIAGGGNNGGDAIVAATRLRQRGCNAQVLLAGERARLPADAARALAQWEEAGGEAQPLPANLDNLPPASLLIDGVFGIGLSRPPEGKWRALIDAINRHPAPALAIDAPSGLDSDSGGILGAAVRAVKTVTFFGGKPGLHTGDGVEVSGRVEIATLGAPAQRGSAALLDAAPSLQRLQRRRNSHKGSHKTLALVGGAPGMLGALVLAARAAATLGAGKTIACSPAPPPLDWQRPDILWHSTAAGGPLADCLAAGMGLGTDRAAQDTLDALLDADAPLLLDADALTLLAQNRWESRLAARAAATILTPHPGEAARLLDCAAADISRHRLAAAAALADKWQCLIVLKGAGTIIQAPGAPAAICAAGNPGLARGGSGDVLSGIIAALLAQSGDAEFSAQAGVWLHAAAADRLAAAQGELGLDINQLAQTAAQLVQEQTR